MPGKPGPKVPPRTGKDDEPRGPKRPAVDNGGTPDGEPGPEALERAQHKSRDEHFGREQGGNQQGNQRGIGNPGDR